MTNTITALLEKLAFFALDPEARRATPAAIASLQVEHGCTLGEDYAWFLAHYGPGGFAAGALAPLPPGNPLGSTFDVDLVYGLGSRREWDPFQLKATTYRGQMPSIYLPIAADPGGNQLLMRCGDGTIHAWDHEHRELSAEQIDAIIDEMERSDLDVSRYDLGQIILMWEHAHADEIGNPSGHGNIHPVAASFGDLLAMLSPRYQ